MWLLDVLCPAAVPSGAQEVLGGETAAMLTTVQARLGAMCSDVQPHRVRGS